MGSNDEAPMATLKLPFIDFSKPDHEELKPGTAYWDSLKSQVREALEEYGIFEASFDKVPMDLRSDAFASLEELFDLPLSTKQRSVDEAAHDRGYAGQQPDYPLYESIGITDPNLPHKVQNFTNTLWPQGNPSFSKNIQSVSEKVAELDQIVRKMIIEGFGLEKYMEEHINSTGYVMRVMRYEPPRTHDPKLGLITHTDKNLSSILCQNEVDGLELQTKNGEWVFIKPSHESFVVLVGDCLYAWLNGRVHCPVHRVRVSGNEPRYSFGLFTVPKAGYMIKAPEELIDEEHPLLFKPFDYMQYLDLTFAPTSPRDAHLRTFFGV